MNAIDLPPRKRKILTIKVPTDRAEASRLPIEEARFVVWREGGDMPKRLYEEPNTPCNHAAALSRQHPGERFHVMRSWRVMTMREEA